MELKRGLYRRAIIASTTLIFPGASYASTQCEGASAVGASCTGSGLAHKITAIIDTIFYIVGALSILILLVGAIRYITSTGDATRIKQAKDTILYAIMGLVIAVLARAIVGFVIGSLA